MTNSYSTKTNIRYCNDDYDNHLKIIEYPDGTYCVQYFTEETVTSTRKILLLPEVVGKTRIIQDIEEKVKDYIYELDKDFVKDNGSYIYDIIQYKAYGISEFVLDEVLKEDYDLFGRTADDVIEEIISLIDFEELYEVVDEILNSPTTLEEKLADVGVSVHDFI